MSLHVHVHWYRYLCPTVNHVKVVWFVVGFYGGELKRSFCHSHSQTSSEQFSSYSCFYYRCVVIWIILLTSTFEGREVEGGEETRESRMEVKGELFAKLAYHAFTTFFTLFEIWMQDGLAQMIKDRSFACSFVIVHLPVFILFTADVEIFKNKLMRNSSKNSNNGENQPNLDPVFLWILAATLRSSTLRCPAPEVCQWAAIACFAGVQRF